jgi:predicted Fe-S protein YdhL (DUF1289 family)
MAQWKQKKPEAEPFSWQTATEKEKTDIIRSVKDELHQLLEDNREIERKLANLHWESLQKGDEVWFHYDVQVGLPVLRLAVRQVRKDVSKKKPSRPKKGE